MFSSQQKHRLPNLTFSSAAKSFTTTATVRIISLFAGFDSYI